MQVSEDLGFLYVSGCDQYGRGTRRALRRIVYEEYGCERISSTLMENSGRYEPDQWQFMNRPETQEKIRQSLKGYLRSFLDTAPEGKTHERFLEILALLKRYFEKELEDSEAEYTELVLATLSAAIRRIPSEEELRKAMDTPGRPVSIEEWDRFERFLEREGMKGWWD